MVHMESWITELGVLDKPVINYFCYRMLPCGMDYSH